MKKRKKLRYRYSGKHSETFWNAVNSLKGADHEVMYALGCVLQNTEDYVLRLLKNYEKTSVKKKR